MQGPLAACCRRLCSGSHGPSSVRCSLRHDATAGAAAHRPAVLAAQSAPHVVAAESPTCSGRRPRRQGCQQLAQAGHVQPWLSCCVP